MILSIGPLRTNFSEILIEIQNFSFTKMHLKTSSAKWRPFCPWRDMLTRYLIPYRGNISKCQSFPCLHVVIRNTRTDLLVSHGILMDKMEKNTLLFYVQTFIHSLANVCVSHIRSHMCCKCHYYDICVCVLINLYPPSAAYMRQWIGSALFQIMACRLFGEKPLPKPMLGYCELYP